MSIDRDPTEPVPAGMVSLPDCRGYLAARHGDQRLVQPVAVYRHAETGELRFEPSSGEIAGVLKAFAAYEELVLLLLRTGELTAYVDGPDLQLSPEFWQYPFALQSLRSGTWKGRRLLASRDELEEIAALTSPRSADPSPDDGVQSEPEPEAVIEPAAARQERRGGKMRHFWPKVLGYAAGWIAERGSLPGTQAELERVITDRVESLGEEAAVSTVRAYAREMWEGYQQQLNDD
jgi:hypothetical protein